MVPLSYAAEVFGSKLRLVGIGQKKNDVGPQLQRLMKGLHVIRSAERRNAADKAGRQTLARLVGKNHPRRSAAKLGHELRLLVIEDDLKLMHALQTLQTGDQLPFCGQQRAAFHARGPIEDIDEPPLPGTNFEIRRSPAEESDLTGAIVESAFFPDGAPEAFRGLMAPLYEMENALAFVATVDGKPVACGTGIVIHEHRVFALCGAGTLSAYRGRGLQTALLQARMSAALQAGCEYAVVVTQGGSSSQRNVERLGFRVAYSKVTVVKKL